MFSNAIKLFFAKRILRNRQLSNKTATDYVRKQVIGVLLNANEVTNINGVLEKIKSEFSSNYKVEFLVYKSEETKTDCSGFYTFSMKDFNVFAGIKSEVVQQFASQEFDFLVNFFKEPELPLLLAANQSKAYNKVGFFNEFELDNVVMIHTEIKDTALFFSTLHKYLILTKLI